MPAIDTKATTLFSLAALKSYIKATGTASDAQIAQLGDSVSEKVESYCRRMFVDRSVTEVKGGPGGRQYNRLSLLNFPINSVSEAKYRFSLLDQWVTLGAAEYELDGPHGFLYLTALAWPVGQRTCSVTYNAGFGARDSTDLPQDVVGAALDWAKFCYDRWKSDTVSANSLTLAAGGGTILVSAVPKDVREALDGYAPVRI